MPDLEIIFDRPEDPEPEPEDNDSEKEEDYFVFELPTFELPTIELPDIEIEFNPTALTWILYILNQICWFGLMMVEYWDIGAFQAGVAFVIYIIVYSVTKIETWSTIKWYSKFLLLQTFTTCILAFLIVWIHTFAAQVLTHMKISNDLHRDFKKSREKSKEKWNQNLIFIVGIFLIERLIWYFGSFVGLSSFFYITAYQIQFIIEYPDIDWSPPIPTWEEKECPEYTYQKEDQCVSDPCSDVSYLNKDGTCCEDENQSIVFVLDESGSITGSEFTKMKNFVKDITSGLNTNQLNANTKLGLVGFGSSAHEYQTLTTDWAQFETALNGINKHGGGTNSRDGLYLAKDQLEFDNADKKFILYISDGASNSPTIN